MAPGRKLPISGKFKKEQLKAKKHQKQEEKKGGFVFLKRGNDGEDEGEEDRVAKLNQQPSTSRTQRSRNVNRYVLQFYKETKAELEEQRVAALQSLREIPESELEIEIEYFFPPQLDFPKRPRWNFGMTKEQLDAHENRYFTEYVTKLENEFGAKNLSYFELNLETWRQLWRVLEMSDIVLIIVDIRFPALMFPPSIYNFVCKDLKKDMILVLNKIDLAAPELVVAWKYYFTEHFPTLKIITFTSFPSYNLRKVPTENKAGMQVRRRRGKLRMAAEGAQKLFEACKEITQNQVDLTSWGQKITEEMNSTYDDEEDIERKIVPAVPDTGYEEHVRYDGGILTIGCIGQPNVGKSSLMNAVMGKKVVSVSRTPGHTKHFQTIYLTPNVRLCDCPGLVFPSKVPRTMQILIGAYPIAQVREPYSVVKYLAERLDLPKVLRILHPENDVTWSAMDVCDGWAKKRGFFTAKAARLDSYRAANHILRMALEGKICLCLTPPGYSSSRDMWKKHADVEEVSWIQAKMKSEESVSDVYDSDSSHQSNEESDKKTAVNEELEELDSDGSDSSDGKGSLLCVGNKFELLGDD